MRACVVKVGNLTSYKDISWLPVMGLNATQGGTRLGVFVTMQSINIHLLVDRLRARFVRLSFRGVFTECHVVSRVI